MNKEPVTEEQLRKALNTLRPACIVYDAKQWEILLRYLDQLRSERQ